MTARKSKPLGDSGFTLIELMVALTLGLIVLGLVLAVYLNNMQAAKFQNGVLRVYENGRFAIDMINRTARMAGYDDPDPMSGTTVSDGLRGASSTANAYVAFPMGVSIKPNTDIVTFRYEGGTGIRDCLGNLVPLNSVRASQYGVQDDAKLICFTDAPLGLGLFNPEDLEIVEGVEDMQVRYGVDPDGNGVANQYVLADNVGGANWNRIVSLEITLLVNSVDNVLESPDNVCMGCTVFAGTTDRRVRAEFQTVVDIRNHP